MYDDKSVVLVDNMILSLAVTNNDSINPFCEKIFIMFLLSLKLENTICNLNGSIFFKLATQHTMLP